MFIDINRAALFGIAPSSPRIAKMASSGARNAPMGVAACCGGCTPSLRVIPAAATLGVTPDEPRLVRAYITFSGTLSRATCTVVANFLATAPLEALVAETTASVLSLVDNLLLVIGAAAPTTFFGDPLLALVALMAIAPVGETLLHTPCVQQRVTTVKKALCAGSSEIEGHYYIKRMPDYIATRQQIGPKIITERKKYQKRDLKPKNKYKKLKIV